MPSPTPATSALPSRTATKPNSSECSARADAYLRDCIALFNEYGWDWTYHAFRESPVWDVEKAGPRFSEMAPDPDTPRKRALREGFGAK